MKLRSTDFNAPGRAGASVVDLESTWQPDSRGKPHRVMLTYAVALDRQDPASPWWTSGAWFLAGAAVLAGLALVKL